MNLFMNKNEKDRCFIITPIGDPNDPIRRHIEGIIDTAIRPALGDKYEIVVSHNITTQGAITKQIIEEIYKDKLVIANLTDKNPNVMYELAFRHCLGKPVILIAEENTRLPSDIAIERTIFYINDPKGALELKERIERAERDIDFSNTKNLLIDTVRDINQKENIVKNFEISKNYENRDSDPLKFILNKLDNIELKIEQGQFNSGKQVKRWDGFYRGDCVELTYELGLNSDNNKNAKDLSQYLVDKFKEKYANDFELKGVELSFDIFRITIIMRYRRLEVEFLTGLLKEFGYKKPELIGYVLVDR